MCIRESGMCFTLFQIRVREHWAAFTGCGAKKAWIITMQCSGLWCHRISSTKQKRRYVGAEDEDVELRMPQILQEEDDRKICIALNDYDKWLWRYISTKSPDLTVQKKAPLETNCPFLSYHPAMVHCCLPTKGCSCCLTSTSWGSQLRDTHHSSCPWLLLPKAAFVLVRLQYKPPHTAISIR